MKNIVRLISQMAEDIRAIRVATEKTAKGNLAAVAAKGARSRR